MHKDSFQDFDSADLKALKTRDQVPFKVTDLPNGGQVRERIYKTADDQGRVFERDFRHEKDLGDGGMSKVFHSYREFRSDPKPKADTQTRPETTLKREPDQEMIDE